MILTVILSLLCCLLLSLSMFLGWKLYKFSIIIIDIEDAVEESLQILDEKYKRMYDILQKPIFFDSVEVRQVISDIRESHNALIYVSDVLTDEKNGLKIEIKEENNS